MKEIAEEQKKNGVKSLSTKEIAALWKNVGDRSKWEALAQADLERYKNEVIAKGYKWRSRKRNSGVKKSWNFLKFLHQNELVKEVQRTKHVDSYKNALIYFTRATDYKGAVIKMSEMWNALSKEQREAYNYVAEPVAAA